MGIYVKVYAIINVLKVTATLAILLYLAIVRKDAITSNYNPGNRGTPEPSADKCQSCLDVAMLDPNRLYEFGYCRSHYAVFSERSRDPNLFVDKSWFSFSPMRSRVQWYLVDIILTVVVGCIVSIVFPVVAFEVFGQKFADGSSRRSKSKAGNDHDDESDSDIDPHHGATKERGHPNDVTDVCIAWNYQIGLLVSVLVVSGGLEMGSLYLLPPDVTHFGQPECYVSPYRPIHLTAVTAFVCITVFLLLIESFVMCGCPNKIALFVFNLLATLTAAGLAILALIMTAQQLADKHDRDWWSAAIVWVGVLHMIETPIVLFCCIPRVKGKVDYLNL